MASHEAKILSAWQTKFALLAAIVVPTITATGAFFKIDTKMAERETQINQRISDVELRVEQNFADKPTMREMQQDIKALRSDMVEIKVLLKRK